MFRLNPNEHDANSKMTGGTACAQDLADTLLTCGDLYQEFASWLDAELERLEARFADYSTTQSLGLPKGRHSTL